MTPERAHQLVVAVDAMGGDFGPAVVVPGAVAALREAADLALALYGDERAVRAELAKLDAGTLPLTVRHCSQDIEMAESPAAAIRGKPDSPIVRAIADHKAGAVDAVVSAGSTGAMVAASLIVLGRLPSVDRPAIAVRIPTTHGHVLLLDAGANVQNTPAQLLSFAEMGDVYAREVLGLTAPRVALLNIGEEESKGSELLVAAHKLLRASRLNFAGNIEGRRLLLGDADVVVTDGFTGNMALKLVEGLAPFLKSLVEHRVPAGERAGVAGALGALLRHLDYADTGGALLLGIAGVSVISHGASNERAIRSAVLAAGRLARHDIPARLQARLAPSA